MLILVVQLNQFILFYKIVNWLFLIQILLNMKILKMIFIYGVGHQNPKAIKLFIII